jgi:methyl-accepting chemotaxis protein
MSDSTHDNPVAEAIQALATHIKYLGNGDAGNTMGAIEFLTTKIDEAATRIADAMDHLAASNEEIAEALTEGLKSVADSLARTGSR